MDELSKSEATCEEANEKDIYANATFEESSKPISAQGTLGDNQFSDNDNKNNI